MPLRKSPPKVEPAVKDAVSPPTGPAPTEASWKCLVSPHVGFPALDELTVGAKFDLKCGGSEVTGFNPQSFSLELAKPDKFRLRILENEKSSTSGVELIVTSYVPGDTSLKSAVLTDGTHRILLEGVDFNVKSVIKKEEQEPPKPFPPEAPVGLMWPTSAIVAIALIFTGILIGMILIVQKRRRRAKFLAWLAANRTPLSPFDQLNKDLRRILKDRNPSTHLSELELVTQTYLSRKFEAPLMTRAPKVILKIIAAKDKKAMAKLSPITIRLFGEFERVSDSLEKSQLSTAEALSTVFPQIHEMIREFAESVQKESSKDRGRG